MKPVHAFCGAAALAVGIGGCDVTGEGAPTGAPSPDGGAAAAPAADYRELASHPGCSTEGLTYAPADIPGYACAAKAYPLSETEEDTAQPIVLLIHGNSDTPSSWEAFPPGEGEPMLADELVARGVRTYAVDLRIDLIDDPQGDGDSENAARNIDHGWGVPITEHFIESILEAHPDRPISLVGFSLGATIIRDALRRIHERGDVDIWTRVDDVVLLAGANHGVSTCGLCGSNPTMRGRVTCELGCRDGYSPTPFMERINGPGGAYETPCAAGQLAFGAQGRCGGGEVDYTTVVMRDIADGSYQDEFVSEESSRLIGADNRLIGLEDVDESGYFFDGLLKNHYGAARSEAALAIILDTLFD